MNFKRIGRFLVCLVLICALLINVSPIRAKAVIVELTVAEAIKWGIIAIATLATCGVVYTITSDADLAAIGQTFYNEAHTTYSAAEKLDEFNQMKEVIGKAYNGRIIPFWSPNGNDDDIIKALMAASIVGFLNLYDNLQPTEITYADPQYLELSQGLTTRHAYLLGGDVKDVSYEVCSGSAPVFTFRYCTARKHTTVFCSSEYFEVNKHAGTTTNYEANAATLSDGLKVYYLFPRTSITGSGGFTSDCVPVSTLYTDSELLEICGGLVANGIPETVLEVPRYVSDLMQANGLLTEDYAIQIPAIDFSSFTSDHEMLDFVGQVASGEKSYQDWLDRVTSGAVPEIVPLPAPDPEPDFTEGTEPTQPILPDPGTNPDPGIGTNPDPVPDPNPDPGPGTGSDPDSGGDSAELNWWQRFSQWFLDLRTSINELPNRFDEHFENLNNNIQEGNSKFETWIQNVQTSVDAVAESILGTADEINATINELPNTFFGQLPVILSAIAAVPEAIVAGLRSLFQELFVPSQEYLNNKLQELVQSYPYLEPIISLGDTFKAYLTGVNPTPPVIWIDLGASAWYPLGGRVKFIDLTWYAQYKSTVDGIMGAFLWLWFLWRLFQSAPGIVSGASGLFGHPDSHPDASFYGPNMIPGQRFLGSGNGLKRNE